jgi:hypothetical protein
MVNIFGEFCMEMFPMKWTLKLEPIDEPGILRSTVVGLIERPEPTCEADLGLTPMTMASFVRSKLIGAGGLIRFLDICAFTVHGTKLAPAAVPTSRRPLPVSFHIARHLNCGICR